MSVEGDSGLGGRRSCFGDPIPVEVGGGVSVSKGTLKYTETRAQV